jgi:hypothetical protein
MPAKKLKISKVDLDTLKSTPVISIDKSADYSIELVSKDIIEHIRITDLEGRSLHESDINGHQFVFNYKANCKDMFLLNIRKKKQKEESQILIL